MQYQEIETQEALQALLNSSKHISYYAFQSVDFTPFEDQIAQIDFDECLFMGCTMSEKAKQQVSAENFIFPVFETPYQLYPNKLYTKETIFDHYRLGVPSSYNKTYDKLVYDHFIQTNFLKENIRETLGRSLHDHSIADAMNDMLANYDERKVVGIMGGHNLPRTDPMFRKIAFVSRTLTQKGYLMITGGGPGGMEATHLGAWFADKEATELEEALETLKAAPTYKNEAWLDTAMQVLNRYQHSKYESLGIPTWLYGHEPPTPFATHIAKFFDNSIREDSILTIAKGGLIFAPGSAGTIQEIFQDATQNHYLTLGYPSPMIFFGKEYWTIERPIFPLLDQMLRESKYENLLLSITDEEEGIVQALRDFYDPA